MVLTTKMLNIDGLEVELARKRVKGMRLTVTPAGQVKVSARPGIPETEIHAFVKGRAPWIRKQQVALANTTAARAERATAAEQAEWRSVVSACTPPLVAEWERILGVKTQTLAYRNMKSRWGSCQPATGRICINTRLALYPPECLEYVVAHELCHLLVHNHGPAFKELMDRIMPDWRDRARKLQK